MGRSSRPRPKHLAKKLKRIRKSLDLSQDEMLIKLGLENTQGLERSVISAFELDKREPSLDILLKYAKVANVYVDALIDDNVLLPKSLPAKTKSEGVECK